MYIVYNKDHIHHLLNKTKTRIFAYTYDLRVYVGRPNYQRYKIQSIF